MRQYHRVEVRDHAPDRLNIRREAFAVEAPPRPVQPPRGSPGIVTAEAPEHRADGDHRHSGRATPNILYQRRRSLGMKQHAQQLASADLARFAGIGVVASMQPYHAIDDGQWADKVMSSGACWISTRPSRPNFSTAVASYNR
jgi:hypothetical protein